MSANLGVAIAKFAAWSVTGSASMLAEGIHSVADTGNQMLLLLGYSRSARPPTPEHPFGYGRERYFWAFIVALVLFTLGGLFALYQGWQKLLHPHELRAVGWAVGVLLVAIVLESAALRTAVIEAQSLRAGRSWWGFVRHAKSPEIPVILLEDTGALLGLAIALLGVGLALVTGDPRWDAIGTLGIGTLLIVIAVVLAIEMQSLLIGESAGPRAQLAIERALESHDRVHQLLHLRTQHLGPDELLVGAKLVCDSSLTLSEIDALIADLEARIRDAVPEASVIYLEPCTADTAPETV
jgi:cation diffusion facilitator family transporter